MSTSSDASLGAPSAASTPSSNRVSRSAFVLLLFLFFVSGATSLVYEVAWTRRLLLVVGSTSTASTVVLAAFLGGLGIGGYVGGRAADRSRRPLALYGVLEALAAGWALLVPVLLAALEEAYVAAARSTGPEARTLLRIAVAAAVVVPGAALVGATLPALLRFFVRGDGQAGRGTAWLYGVNTLGAVLGSLWAGFVGVFAFGVVGASRLAAFAALGVALVALLVSRASRLAPPREIAAPLASGRPTGRGAVPRLALVAAALCGFVALGLEASSIRVLVFFVEGFTASFAAMLGVFLAGLGIGSLVLGPRLSRRAEPARAVAVLLAAGGAAAILCALAVPRFEGWLHGVRVESYRRFDAETAQWATALAGSALLVFLPSVFLGATFPLCVRWAEGEEGAAGRAAGRVYLANSVGSVVSPLLLTLVGFRAFGPLASWTLFGALAFAAGLSAYLAFAVPRRGIVAAAVLGLALGVGVPWTLSAATPEALVRASHVLASGGSGGSDVRRLAEARSDDVTTASVVETAGGDRILYTDDFQAAATGRFYPYMRMLGHLPTLLAAQNENAMVIAFGTGTTAGAVAAHSGVKRLEIVETSRAVLDMADRFRSQNRGVLSDVRVRLRVDDGRNALLLHAADLDVLTLEPLMPYTPAALPFYTRDFYLLARDRLREGGVLCQWVPVHAMRPDLYAALLRTFFEVFPDGSLWFFEQSTALIGRKGEARPDVTTMRARAGEIEKPLRDAGFQNPAIVAASCVASGRRVLAAIDEAEGGASPLGPLATRRVTDEDPFPEAYPAPRAPGRVTAYLARTLAFLAGLVDGGPGDPMPADGAFAPPEAIPRLRASMHQNLAARAADAEADFRLALASHGGPDSAVRLAEAITLLEDAARGYGEALMGVGRGDRAVLQRSVRAQRALLTMRARALLAESRGAAAAGETGVSKSKAEDSLAVARRAYELTGADAVRTERPQAAGAFAESLMRLGRCREAEDLLTTSVRAWAGETWLVPLLAAVHARRMGRDDLAPPSAEATAFLDGAFPCREEGLAPVVAQVAKYQHALSLGNADEMRTASVRVAHGVREMGVPAADAAAALKAGGPAGNAEIDAIRAAAVRAVDSADPALGEMLRSGEAPRRTAALAEAAILGFERLDVVEAVEAEFFASKEPSDRATFSRAAGRERSRWSLERLADLLDDPEESVRAIAFASLSASLPQDRGGFGYDPKGDGAARSVGIAKIREWVASRP